MRTKLLLVLSIALIAASCSGSVEFSIGGQSPEQAAEKLIESEIADQVELGELEAECNDLKDPEVGSSFECIATTADGQTIELITVIDREDHIDVNTTNLLTAADLPRFEVAGTGALSEQAGVELPAGTIQCGTDAVILPAEGTFICDFHDPSNTDVYDITITVTDIVNGDFDLSIADEPKN